MLKITEPSSLYAAGIGFRNWKAISNHSSSAVRSSLSQRTPETAKQDKSNVLGKRYPIRHTIHFKPSLVGRTVKPICSNHNSERTSHYGAVHRCFNVRMGGYPKWNRSARPLAHSTSNEAYKPARNSSSTFGYKKFAVSNKLQMPLYKVRQRNCPILHQKEGRHVRPGNDLNCCKNLAMGQFKGNTNCCPTYSRRPEFHRRPVVQNRTGPKRLETGPISVPKTKSPAGADKIRPFCKLRELPGAKVFLLEKPAGSRESKCNATPLASAGSVCISPILPPSWDSSKNPKGRLPSTGCYTSLENSNMVPQIATHVLKSAHSAPKQGPADKSSWRGIQNSTRPENEVSRLDIVRARLQMSGVPERASDIIAQGHRPSTNTSYASAFRKFNCWCREREINPLSVNINQVIEFLTEIFDTGLKVSSLGVIRSALSDTLGTLDGHILGQHPTIIRLLDGMAALRPAKYKDPPRWNVDTVLEHILTWGDNMHMDMRKLTLKLTMLFALATAARCNELADLRSNLVYRTKDGIRFKLEKHRKQRKSSEYPGYLDIPSFPQQPLLCPVSCYDWYMIKTAGHRLNEEDDYVFRAMSQPYGKVATSTISRWLSTCISETGYDDSNHPTAHSVRGAAATKAMMAGLSTKQIMSAVEWKSESVYYDHYRNQEFNPEFGRSVLKP